MKIFIIASKSFYDKVPEVKKALEEKGHEITLPNSYDNPFLEEEIKKKSEAEHASFKKEMYELSEKTIRNCDAVLVLNFEKHGVKNYIGGATFLEMYNAFRFGKKIYIYNDIPLGYLRDEIAGFAPILLNGDLTTI